jgi:hypothetical protein
MKEVIETWDKYKELTREHTRRKHQDVMRIAEVI